MLTAAQLIAEYTARLTLDQVPDTVVTAAGLHALDTIGCGLAAFALADAEFIHDAVREEHAPGTSSAIGFTTPMAESDAALVNGVRSHALDFDDTHPDSVVHVNASVAPAALAAGESVGAPGADVLAAIIAGDEISVRLGTVAEGQFHARGFHPTGMVGIFGATVAAARVHGLDPVRTSHALGLAGSMAGGLLEFLADGAQTKPLHPGWAAKAALTAVRLARHGATGPATVFEGRRGFYATYLHGMDVNLEPQLTDLGTRYETPRIAYKPYAACHYTHAPVDALAELIRIEQFTADDVDHIVALTEATGVGLVLEPAAVKANPGTNYDTKFSLPFCLAHQLVRGQLPVDSFTTERAGDPAIRAVMPKVRYELRQYSSTPDSFGGGVRVVLRDGRSFVHELRHQRGGAENPLLETDIRGKYRENAGLALPTEESDRLEDFLTALPAAVDMSAFAVVRDARRAHSLADLPR